jgi:hypothetical protein
VYVTFSLLISKWIAFYFDSPKNILANLGCLFSPFAAYFLDGAKVFQALPIVM